MCMLDYAVAPNVTSVLWYAAFALPGFPGSEKIEREFLSTARMPKRRRAHSLHSVWTASLRQGSMTGEDDCLL